MERPKMEIKQVWAVKELTADSEIDELLKSIPSGDAQGLPLLMKKCFLLGFNVALQQGASYLNEKELYNFANELLKIGQKEV